MVNSLLYVYMTIEKKDISFPIFSNVSGLSSTNQSKKSLKPLTGHGNEKRNDRYNLKLGSIWISIKYLGRIPSSLIVAIEVQLIN